MPTVDQIRAARGLINWSQSELATRAGLSQAGIARIENGTSRPNTSTLDKIQRAFDESGIEFVGMEGVRKRRDEVIILEGPEGLRELINDLYNTCQKAHDNGENIEDYVYLYNANPENWHKWLGEEWWDMHAARMTKIGSDIQRIMVSDDNSYIISSTFSKHRALPGELFNDQSIYAYGNKLAFVTFSEAEVSVKILKNQQFCDGFRVLFNIAWDQMEEPAAKG